MSEISSKVDKEARQRAATVLRNRFLQLIDEIRKGEPPVMEIPQRNINNTHYDEVRKLLLLGDKKLRRSFLDLNEAKRFMQTSLMGSIIYEALVNDEYPTIRDLYYRGKHTLVLRGPDNRTVEENTWDEQKESDSVIVDIEVFHLTLKGGDAHP